MLISVIVSKAGELIFYGFCLSIGFYAGKQVTNKVDEFIYTHSKEFVQHQKDVAINTK